MGNKRQKVQSKQQKQKRGSQQGKTVLFSIRSKIIVCFLVPIIFMVMLGIISYQKAAEGMSTSFRESTQETVDMASAYVDMTNSFIEAEALKYVVDSELGKYFIGVYGNDPVKETTLANQVTRQILASQVGNSFISNIYIITEETTPMISTKSKSQNGIYEAYMAEMAPDGNLADWDDHHDVLDEKLLVPKDSYILTCQRKAQTGKAVIVIDVKADAIRSFLQDMNLGDGSYVGFVTAGGREIAVQHLAGEETGTPVEDRTVFADKDFFAQTGAAQEAQEVVFEGENYLYFSNVSEKTGATMCALVPMHVVTSQAESIKNLTVMGVVVSSVIAALIGLAITSGIRGNMHRISGSLKVVADGNLATQVSVRGNDEFQGLAAAANNMIANNKQLVQKVNLATDKLAVSADEVTEASGVIQEYSVDIAHAISEINDGMEKQSVHAQECVVKTGTLSEEIQQVSNIAREVESLVANAEEMIHHGMELVQVLGERAGETTAVTAKVEESILAVSYTHLTLPTILLV